MQGPARLRESKLGSELTWDVRQFSSLEAKELDEQVTNGLGIYLESG